MNKKDNKGRKIKYIIIVIIFIMCLLFALKPLNNNRIKQNILSNFNKASYNATVRYYLIVTGQSVMKGKDKSLSYKYKDDIEVQCHQDPSCLYIDYVNQKRYIKRGDIYLGEPYKNSSYKEKILTLLKKSTFQKKDKNVFDIQPSNKTLDEFLESFYDEVRHNEKDKFEITLTVKDDNITELKLYASKTKYLIFTFDDINKIEDIKLPEDVK